MSKKRRPLIAGIKNLPKVNPDIEKAFVFGKSETAKKPRAIKQSITANEPTPIPAPAQETTPAPEQRVNPRQVGRVPLTTRIRTELHEGLKFASLTRQLAKEHPNTLQEILEEALEPWLRERGYLKLPDRVD